jgi:creatinine amidohydrolase
MRETRKLVQRQAEDDPASWREALGDGSFGGLYQRPDEDALHVWSAAVQHLRARMADKW